MHPVTRRGYKHLGDGTAASPAVIGGFGAAPVQLLARLCSLVGDSAQLSTSGRGRRTELARAGVFSGSG